MTNLPCCVVIKPNVFPLNRPQRAQVRVHYRMLRGDGVSRPRAHMVLHSLLSTGMNVGAAQAGLQRQWPIDKLGPSVED